MKKTVIRSTFYLILISVIAKILSFLVRIMLARTLSESAMNYYSLASPTMVFMITLAQMGIPNALSKVIAESRTPHKPLKAAILLSILNNLVIVCVFLFLLPFLAHVVLKQDVILPVLYAILPLLPIVTISGLLKGYLFGIQKHLSATACQIFEEGSRILFLMISFSLYPNMDAVTMAKLAMISISIGEVFSSIYMFFALSHKKKVLFKAPSLFHDLQRVHFDEVLHVSIPMTGSRLIGSLTYFLEPIVMVYGLSALQADTMINAYGSINGYILPIITMPSFLTVTLSNFLLPSFTYHYSRHHDAQAKKLFSTILGCCFVVGMGCSVLCFFFSEELLQLFYHTSKGAPLLKQMAWPFALYALQPPLSSMLHALSLSKKTVGDTFFGSLTRILCVAFLSSCLGADALIIGITAGMLVTTILHAIRLTLAFRKTNSLNQVPF